MLVSGVFVTLMAIRTRPLTPVIILRGVRSVSSGLGALWLVALEIGFSRILHRARFDVYGVHRFQTCTSCWFVCPLSEHGPNWAGGSAGKGNIDHAILKRQREPH